MAGCSPYQPVVDLIGGEPLLYPHLIETVKLASRRNVLAAVTTNGLKLKDKAEDFVRAELPLLQVSVDGLDEPSQAARGFVKGSFDRICEGVRAVEKAKGKRPVPMIRALIAITRVNHAHLDRIQVVIAAPGIRSWGIANYFYVNRNAHNGQIRGAVVIAARAKELIIVQITGDIDPDHLADLGGQFHIPHLAFGGAR